MNVQLLPAALEDFAVLRASGYRGAGFLLGTTIGRFVVVERLLPLDFGRRGSDAVFAAAHKQYGERRLGAFFCRKPPFTADWLVGDLVLVVRAREIAAFTCEFDRARKSARLVPLPEDEEAAGAAEEKWPG